MQQVSSVKEYIETLPMRFVASAAVDAVFHLYLTGEVGGNYYVTVKGGTLSVESDYGSTFDLEINTDAWDFINMANGRMDPMMAYMKRTLKYNGNFLLQKNFWAMFPQDFSWR